MKAWEVIGYTADAEVWCPDCAKELYGPITHDTEDHEGNPISPIFAADEWDYPPICSLCHELLMD